MPPLTPHCIVHCTMYVTLYFWFPSLFVICMSQMALAFYIIIMLKLYSNMISYKMSMFNIFI